MLQSRKTLRLAIATLALSFAAGCAQQATVPTHDAATSGPELAGAWYQIYFDTGSIAINGRGQMIVKNVAYVIANGGPARVTVIGRTDRVGSAPDNLALSARRANVVRDALVAASERLAGRAAGLGEVPLAVGHGDLQPGNVLVSRDGREVTIIDWEHSAERWRHYDRLTWAVGGRGGLGLAERLGAVVEGAAPAGLPALPAGRGARQQAVALYLLEDLLWFAHESRAGPYRRVSGGLSARLAELPRLLAVAGVGA